MAEYLELLKDLIRTPSFSKQEAATADLLESYLRKHGAVPQRIGNNVWSRNLHFSPEKPTLLLHSHHDTVRPNANYTRDPFAAELGPDGQLYGLGSNDAGGALVTLLDTFLHFYARPDLTYNLLFAGGAEEEIGGAGGVAKLLPELPPIDCAIVGEPTEMHLAIAERGLLVIDGYARGRSGHAAHGHPVNAIFEALPDVQRLQGFRFERESALLGPVRVSVTGIETGLQHNVVPGECHFVLDVRVNELYTNQEVFETLQAAVKSELRARSFRLSSSTIDPEHPLVRAGVALGRRTYGSPTLSDQALMPFPSLKMGPGISTRSHQPDEFVLVRELEEGRRVYRALLEGVLSGGVGV